MTSVRGWVNLVFHVFGVLAVPSLPQISQLHTVSKPISPGVVSAPDMDGPCQSPAGTCFYQSK